MSNYFITLNFDQIFNMSFLNKLKSAFGNTKDMEISSSNSDIEAIISDISEHEPFAISDQNVLYAGLNELGGYYFFQTVVIGALKVKSKKGGQLKIEGIDLKLQLASDSVEFESDPTDVKGRWITKIDFQIEEKDAAKILKPQLKTLVLTVKNQNVIFSIYDIKDNSNLS